MTENEYYERQRKRMLARKRRRRKVMLERMFLALAIIAVLSGMIFYNMAKGKSDKNPVAGVFGMLFAGNDSNPGAEFTNEELSDKYPLLLQTDERWADAPYGRSTVAVSGCAPTCISMASLALNKKEAVTPDVVAEYSYENGYYVEGSGTKWTLLKEGLGEFSLTAEELPLSRSQMEGRLDEGKVLILAVGPGDFTTEGHFILIYGYTADGFLVNDPNSRENSSKTWSYDRISGQIRNIWAISANE